MEKQKCSGCEIKREPIQFIYNSKVNKTCIICCEKRKKRYTKEPITLLPIHIDSDTNPINNNYIKVYQSIM